LTCQITLYSLTEKKENRLSKEEFAIKLFGDSNQSKDIIENYYQDWKNSGYNIDLYKMLLKTRG
tara:strand:+ start:815 stop:1006 length:192 start_codon:yes stop_codon:yes gene_type:complete